MLGSRSGPVAFGSVVGAVAVCLLMGAGPAALGAHVATTPILPPYKGSSAVALADNDANCGTAGGTNAHWTSATGTVTGASRASVHPCGNQYTYELDYGEHFSLVSLPFHVTKSGYYNVTTDYSWKGNSSMNWTTGPCPTAKNYSSGYDHETCFWFFFWYALVYYTIEDMTNHTTVSAVAPFGYVENVSEVVTYNDCNNGTCSSTTYHTVGSSSLDTVQQSPHADYSYAYVGPGPSTASGSVWSNTTSWDGSHGTNHTLNPTHKYAIEFEIGFAAEEYISGSSYVYNGTAHSFLAYHPPGSGSSSVTALGGTNGLTITSIAITKVV